MTPSLNLDQYNTEKSPVGSFFITYFDRQTDREEEIKISHQSTKENKYIS